MPTPPEERDERLEVLFEAIAQLVRRQRELEARVPPLSRFDAPVATARGPVPPPEPAHEQVPPETPLGSTRVN